jgi:hypothetical protein
MSHAHPLRLHCAAVTPRDHTVLSHPEQSDASTSVAVHVLLGWLVGQVGLILVFSDLQDAALSHVRMLVMGSYWLTCRQLFELRVGEDLLLGISVIGFERFLEWWCEVPLSTGWIVIALLWATCLVAPATRRRLNALVLQYCYTLFCSAVYATTTTERLQSRYFCRLNRGLAATFENLRRRCAYKLCAFNQTEMHELARSTPAASAWR